MEGVRLIQCYSCFCWCKHLRPDCPNKYDAQICSHCSEIGHSYTECPNDPKCINCHGRHSATARICPEYIKALESQKTKIAEQLAYLILPFLLYIISPDLINIFKTVTLQSHNPYDFLNSLLHACKSLFKTDSPQSPNETNNSFSTPDTSRSDNDSISNSNEILTKDESSLLFGNNHSNIIKDATQTAEIELPKVNLLNQIHLPDNKAPSSDQMHTLDDNLDIPLRYGLTNNGIEQIKTPLDPKLKICGLVKDNKIHSTHIYIEGKDKIYLKPIDDQEPLIIYLSSLENVSLQNHNIFLNLKDKYFHLKIYKNWDDKASITRSYDNQAALKLTKWLHNRFKIEIEYEI